MTYKQFAACLLAASLSAAELPVREVVLYKHGVGYFERGGRLAPGETARLDFRASEMDDVLKSLTLHGTGAPVSALRYDASEPLAARLEEFPFRMNDEQPSLAGFLHQLRGAHVQLRFASEQVTGAIVSARLVPAGEQRAERQELVLLLDNGEMRTLDLGAASSVRFPDQRLQNQLREYLQAVAGARSREKRSVYVDSKGSAAGEITASYMLPAPVWKSSYRLIFPEAAGSPVLEGWAIVDNTTGDDWDGVQLALVSGRPISFLSRLYEPRYVARASAELPEERATAPVVFEGGVVAGVIGGAPAAAPPPAPLREMASGSFARKAKDDVTLMAQDVSPSTLAAQAVARELGELFEYRFSEPVTVKRGQSAMLPFLQQKIEARRLLIYSDAGSVHPMSAAELTNATGKTLDGGPVTVFDSGAYAGEALMSTLKTGDRRLIGYAVDLGTRVTTHFDSGSRDVREIHVRRGVLSARHTAQEIRTYTARNVDAKPKTLIIQHAARDGYKLAGLKPAESTTDAYRFEVKLPANGTEKLAVVEEREYEETHALMNATPDFLLTWVQNKALSETGRRQMGALLELKRQQADTVAQLGSVRNQVNAASRDQERLRQNIESLNRVSGQQEQVQRYARTLAEQETKIAALRDREGELEAKRLALGEQINAAIDKMEF